MAAAYVIFMENLRTTSWRAANRRLENPHGAIPPKYTDNVRLDCREKRERKERERKETSTRIGREARRA